MLFRNFQHIQLEGTTGNLHAQFMLGIGQLIDNDTSLPWCTAWQKPILINWFSINPNRTLHICSSPDDCNAASHKLAAKFGIGSGGHGSTVIEGVLFHCLNRPIFIINNAVCQTVNPPHIQRKNRNWFYLQVSEHIPRIGTCQTNSSRVNHTLRRIPCQHISIDEYKNGIPQYKQFQGIPLVGQRMPQNAFCTNIVHVHQLPAAISV